MTTQTIYAALAGVSLFGSALLLAYITLVSRWRGIDIVNRKGSAAWETLAEAYEKRITHLESSLHEVETAHLRLTADYASTRERCDELVKLNLQLQTTNSAQFEKISRLEDQNPELTLKIYAFEACLTPRS